MDQDYISNRDYGCRVRRFQMDGVEMASLENSRLKAVLALGKGADIVELLYKPTDTDFLWHSFNRLQNITHQSSIAPGDGNFLDSYSGGWQELFPTYGEETHYRGGQIGVHGEACLYPWTCAVTEDTPSCVQLKLTLRTIRTPFLLEKTLTLREDAPRLEIHQKVTNLGSTEQEFMWGHHPAFGRPFLDGNVRLRLDGRPTVTVPGNVAGAPNCPFAEETSGPWPTLPGRGGVPVDMSRAYPPREKRYMEYLISGLEAGKYELVNPEKGLGLRMRWDIGVFPYLWIWGLYCGLEDYPWYGRAYVMGVEPWSSFPGSYDAARRAGTTLHLAPGAAMETDISAEAFLTQTSGGAQNN